MRIVIFASNGIRHKFVANTITKNADDTLVVSECNQNDALSDEKKDLLDPIEEHFHLRYMAEKKFFTGNDFFVAKTLPLLYKEANLHYTYDVVKKFQPDLMVVFGSSIIKEPLLSLLKSGRLINLHLGLSPYYRGSGTNFWPFVNKELEYVGSTILHLDAGIDTGDIIAHVRPEIEIGDDVHIVGCKVIKSSVSHLNEIINSIRDGKELNRVKQWKVQNERYYKKSDFNELSLLRYKKNLEEGVVEDYLKKPKDNLKLIS